MSGICIPGATIIGNVSTGAGGGGADLTDIDATAERTDPRLIFDCLSPRAVITKDGTIKFAAANEWPVEYRDGVAVGRHEPEPQATNLAEYSSDLTHYTANGTANITTSSTLTNPTGSAAMVVTTSGKVGDGLYVRGLVTQGETYTASVFVHVPTLSAGSMTIGLKPLGGETITVDFAARTSTVPVEYKYGFDDFSGGWVRYWFTGTATETTARHAFVFYGGASSVFAIWGAQIEAGTYPTSPIVTTGTAATRAAALAFVQNPALFATAARVYYTDGTTYDIEFNGAAHGEIPTASKPWSTRYIDGVSYTKGFSR